jgi:hypothetical protein
MKNIIVNNINEIFGTDGIKDKKEEIKQCSRRCQLVEKPKSTTSVYELINKLK